MGTLNGFVDRAISFTGYLEKATNANLNSFTANAGYNNYTCFGRDVQNTIGLGAQGAYWCATFVVNMLIKEFGLKGAKKALGGSFSIYTPTMVNTFKAAKQWYTSPKKGDLVFFKNSERVHHVAIVTGVTTKYVKTVEGNTSGASGVIANGGGVCQKTYKLTNSKIAGYGRLIMSGVPTSTTTTTTTKTETVKAGSWSKDGVKAYQNYLNTTYKNSITKHRGALLVVDGAYGVNTRAASLLAFKYQGNKLGAGFTLSNTNYGPTCKKYAAMTAMVVVKGMTTPIVSVAQGELKSRGYYTGNIDAQAGSGTVSAINAFRKANGLSQTGKFDEACWTLIFG